MRSTNLLTYLLTVRFYKNTSFQMALERRDTVHLTD